MYITEHCGLGLEAIFQSVDSYVGANSDEMFVYSEINSPQAYLIRSYAYDIHTAVNPHHPSASIGARGEIGHPGPHAILVLRLLACNL
jgi:hypothetical protein